MRRLLQISLPLSLCIFIVTLASSTNAQGNKPNPTEQFQTIEAMVQSYFDQTATVEGFIANGESEWLTATASFQEAVDSQFNIALTATARANFSSGNTIDASLNTNQTANVRGCASTDCAVVGTVSPSEIFSIKLKEGEWFLIEFGEDFVLGYIYAPLVAVPDGANVDSLPTLTPSPSPQPSPTATNTPLPPTPTPDLAMTATMKAYGQLVEPRGSGIYQVGINIAPGTWESTGVGGGCYWERLDQYGDINGNHYGFAGGMVTIRDTDYEVMFEDCGIFEYVELRENVLQADAYEPKDDGFYTVGVEIAPGSWRSTGVGDDCYWERLSKYQDINDNHFGRAGGSVYINSADFEVHFHDCGMWEYVGP